MKSLDFNDDIDDVVAAVGSVDVDDDVIVAVVVETNDFDVVLQQGD